MDLRTIKTKLHLLLNKVIINKYQTFHYKNLNHLFYKSLLLLLNTLHLIIHIKFIYQIKHIHLNLESLFHIMIL